MISDDVFMKKYPLIAAEIKKIVLQRGEYTTSGQRIVFSQLCNELNKCPAYSKARAGRGKARAFILDNFSDVITLTIEEKTEYARLTFSNTGNISASSSSDMQVGVSNLDERLKPYIPIIRDSIERIITKNGEQCPDGLRLPTSVLCSNLNTVPAYVQARKGYMKPRDFLTKHFSDVVLLKTIGERDWAYRVSNTDVNSSCKASATERNTAASIQERNKDLDLPPNYNLFSSDTHSLSQKNNGRVYSIFDVSESLKYEQEITKKEKSGHIVNTVQEDVPTIQSIEFIVEEQSHKCAINSTASNESNNYSERAMLSAFPRHQLRIMYESLTVIQTNWNETIKKGFNALSNNILVSDNLDSLVQMLLRIDAFVKLPIMQYSEIQNITNNKSVSQLAELLADILSEESEQRNSVNTVAPNEDEENTLLDVYDDDGLLPY